jgi:dipeptidyl aminopeptidase/acylaminoacyl peptidase
MPKNRKRLITSEDLYDLEVISDVRISPSGEHVIFTQQRVDPENEKKYSNLWVVGTDGGKPSQFTYGDQKDYHPRWSPDGETIAFLSNRADKKKPANIYLIPFQGGEARRLSEIKGTIGSFSWSPNGKKFLCKIRKTDQEILDRQEDGQKEKLGTVKRHYDRVFYKLDGEGYLPQERWHIWTVNVNTGRGKQLTKHTIYDEIDPTCSPDGKLIAFMSNRSIDPDLEPDAVDLFVMPASGGKPRKVSTPLGAKTLPSFSPDGRYIAYFGTEGLGIWYRNQGLWIVPTDGSSGAINLTESYDVHVSPMTINDVGAPEIMPPTWTNDGDKLFFPIVQNGRTLLCSIGLDGKDFTTIAGEQGVVGSYAFNSDQTCLAYFMGKMDDPGQIYTREMRKNKESRITKVNEKLFSKLDLGEIEEVWIKGPDNNDLQGWILKPPGFDPSKKYPSILEIHGGPWVQYGEFFMHEFYFLAANGYVVHFCNPRGGHGYGEEHARAIWGGWGDADYRDLMAWTDYVENQPYINKKRMGVSSDLNWIFQEVLNDKPPFEDLDKFWEHSPIKYIGNAKTPTLVIHSENDLRCPIEQGEQVFVALKTLGVDTEMVRFPGEFHGLSRNGRTDRRIARLNHIVRWFDKYLKN